MLVFLNHQRRGIMVSKAMIMAAGVGSRLTPLTQDIPKPLIPIANRPVMDILLEQLRKASIKDVIANTHYLSDKIISRYDNDGVSRDIGINFNYVYEETLSGTAGGVKKCQHFFDKGEDFLVMSADGLSNVDLTSAIASHKESGAIASIGIKQIEEKEIPNFGVVVTDSEGFISEFQEKPSIEEAKSNNINTGIYIFKYEIFDYIPANCFYDFAKNVFPDLLSKGIKINTFKVTDYWSDIGTIEQYLQSTRDLFENLYDINHSKIIKMSQGSCIVEDSKLSPSMTLLGFNTIGKNCSIGENVTLDNCIIWDKVTIKEGLTLKNCIIASGSQINASMDSQVIGPNKIVNN